MIARSWTSESTADPADLVRIRGLCVDYGSRRALDHVTLRIPAGEVFGLLGPNGAGKSSLMRTIATLQDADSGSIQLGNINVSEQKEEVRKVLGYLPQEFGVYPKISAEMMLDHIARLKGIVNSRERKETVEALLQKVNLHKDRKRNLGTYSGGMKQRFGIAQALIGNPKLLIRRVINRQDRLMVAFTNQKMTFK